jgi:uncharacterized protein YjiS (DUF1127 family)
MTNWYTNTFRYYNTIIELMALSDEELDSININREEIISVAYSTHLVPKCLQRYITS